MTDPNVRPTLVVGSYAFIDMGDSTVLCDTSTGRTLFFLSNLGEYALARMLIEKTQDMSDAARREGEVYYQDHVSKEGRTLGLQ